MNRTVLVNNMALSHNEPKICVPLLGTSLEEVLWEINALREKSVDIFEWRVDFFKEDVFYALPKIIDESGEIPLLFTYRTKEEGGKGQKEGYEKLILKAIEKRAKLIDIELCCGDDTVKKLTAKVREQGAVSVVSAHFFKSTPGAAELESLYNKMEQLGADIPKVAAMPLSFEDVLRFMGVSSRVKQENSPIISISMGSLGGVTRLCPRQIGSCLSFAAGKLASAPGQLKPELVRAAIDGYGG